MPDPAHVPDRPRDDAVPRRSRSAVLADRARRLWAAHAAFLMTAAVLLALIAGFSAVAEEVYDDVTDGGGVAGVDRPVLDSVAASRTPALTFAAQALAWSGDTVGATLVALALVALLWRVRRDLTPLVLTASAMAGSVLITTLGKSHVGRLRPPHELALPPLAHSPAFPSGHTLNATVLLGIVLYLVLITPRLRVGGSHRWAVALTAVAAALYVLAMGLSRVYLAAHWLTDVMAGWAIGAGWVLAVVLAHRVWLTVRGRRSGVPVSLAP